MDCRCCLKALEKAFSFHTTFTACSNKPLFLLASSIQSKTNSVLSGSGHEFCCTMHEPQWTAANTIFNARLTGGDFLCLYITNCFLWNKISQWTYLLNHWLLLIKVTPDLQFSINQVCLHRLVGLRWQTHHRTKRWIAPTCIAYLSSPVLYRVWEVA